jgi:hypothetical protein
MMKRKFVVCFLAVFLCGATAAEATVVGLYSDDDYQYFGPGANGKRRSQHFSPTESTPNALGGPGQTAFNSAAFEVTLDAGEALTGRLELYAWNTDYSTTIGGTPIAWADLNLMGPVTTQQQLFFPPQEADSSDDQYLLSLLVGTVTGTDFGLRRSNSNDGGPNNDAYNDSGIKTDREYQVWLNAVPEPSSLALLLVGGLGLLRRRR